MTTFIFRSGQQLGPFTDDEIRSRLSSGMISLEDFAWREGFTDWVPVKSLYSAAPTKPPELPQAAVKEKSEKQGCSPITTIGVIFIVVVLIVFLGTQGSDTSTSATPEAKSEKTLSVGEVAPIKNFDFSIESVKVLRNIGDKQAAGGGIFVCVKYKFKNTSGKPIGSFSFPTVRKLISPKDAQYSADVGATVLYTVLLGIDSKVVSDLNPNLTAEGATVFEVAESELGSGWKLNIQFRPPISYQVHF